MAKLARCPKCGLVQFQVNALCKSCDTALPYFLSESLGEFKKFVITKYKHNWYFACEFENRTVECPCCPHFDFHNKKCGILGASLFTCEECSALLSAQYTILKMKLEEWDDDSPRLCCICNARSY